MTSTFPTTTIDQPTQRMSRLGIGATRRALAKVRLRLRQSIRGYATAATLAGSQNISRFANRHAARRADDLARFENALWEANVNAGTLADIAGTIHRRWMTIVGSESNSALKAEIGRGEASLEAAIRRAIEISPGVNFVDERVTEELKHLLHDVVQTRRNLQELPVLTAGASS